MNIDKKVFELELLGQMRAQRLHAVALGRVMTGRDERYTAFRRRVHGRLGDFPVR